MGCAGSTAIAKEKAAIVSLEINGLKQAWNAISVSGGGNVLKCEKVLARAPARSGAKLRNAAGQVLLDIVPHGNKMTEPYCFNTPEGKTVVLFANTGGGDVWSRCNSIWVIWTAEDAAQTGQPPEATPTGASMFKFGTIKTTSSGAPEFFDASNTKVMTVKDWRPSGRENVVVYSADGTSAMAVVEGMHTGSPPTWKGDVTFATGVDPIIALCMASAGNSVAHGETWDAGYNHLATSTGVSCEK